MAFVGRPWRCDSFLQTNGLVPHWENSRTETVPPVGFDSEILYRERKDLLETEKIISEVRVVLESALLIRRAEGLGARAPSGLGLVPCGFAGASVQVTAHTL